MKKNPLLVATTITMAAGEEPSWVADMEQKAMADTQSVVELWKRPSIYRVAGFLQESDARAYMPKVVSFGPYHHCEGEGRFLVTEEHKQRALFRLLRRSGKPLADYVRAMRAVVHELQGSYDTLDEEYWADEDRFLKLMIVDGSFMLEVLRHNVERDVVEGYHIPNDGFFGPDGIFRVFPLIRRDMLLMENQLPLLVLQMLVAVEGRQPSDLVDYINRLVLQFVERMDYGPTMPKAGLHVLDLFRQRVVLRGAGAAAAAGPQPRPPQPRSRSTLRDSWDASKRFSASAVELAEAGVVFRRSDTTTLADIRLGIRHGVLPLAPLFIDHDTEATILNLLAFEWRHVGVGNEVTGFVLFVDDIIKSADDVRLLRRSGIIRSSLSDKYIASLFSRVRRAVINFDPLDNAFGEIRHMLSLYCQKTWPRWRANIRQQYFRSPTSIINFIAIALTILLTFLQTLYAIQDFHRSGKSGSTVALPSPSFTPSTSSSTRHHL